jgi:hypothetical protein
LARTDSDFAYTQRPPDEILKNSGWRGLRWLFLFNAVAMLAAAIVLALAPAAIPAAVGIEMGVEQSLLAYLLAAAELALAVLCLVGARTAGPASAVQVVWVLVVFHLSSALAGVAALSNGTGSLVLWNVLARVLIVAALLLCAKVAFAKSSTD